MDAWGEQEPYKMPPLGTTSVGWTYPLQRIDIDDHYRHIQLRIH